MTSLLSYIKRYRPVRHAQVCIPIMSRVSKKDEPSSEYCGVVNFCKNCLLRKTALIVLINLSELYG